MPDFENVYDKNDVEMLRDAYDAITQCNLWDWMRTYEPEEGRGFMFSRDPNLDAINDAMKYTGHSGASYALVMRQMQAIAKAGGWEPFKARVLRERPCPCRLAKGYKTGWCGVAGGGVPGCDH